MTKEECIALLNRYAEYNGMGIPNLAGCREAMRTAAELLQESSLPSNLEEAIETYAKNRAKAPELCYEYLYYEIQEAVRFGVEWVVGQGVSKEGEVFDNNEFIKFPDGTFIDLDPS